MIADIRHLLDGLHPISTSTHAHDVKQMHRNVKLIRSFLRAVPDEPELRILDAAVKKELLRVQTACLRYQCNPLPFLGVGYNECFTRYAALRLALIELFANLEPVFVPLLESRL